MKSLQSSVLQWVRPLYRRLRKKPSLEATKRLYFELISDIQPDRCSTLSRNILKARHYKDMYDLRSALFGTVSLSFGEREARQRVARLDAMLF